MQGEVRSRFGLFVLESQSGGFDQYHQVLSSFLRNLGCENVEISGAKRRDRHRVGTPYLTFLSPFLVLKLEWLPLKLMGIMTACPTVQHGC